MLPLVVFVEERTVAFRGNTHLLKMQMQLMHFSRKQTRTKDMEILIDAIAVVCLNAIKSVSESDLAPSTEIQKRNLDLSLNLSELLSHRSDSCASHHLLPARCSPTFQLTVQDGRGRVPPQVAVRVLHHLLLRLGLLALHPLLAVLLTATPPQLPVLRLQLLDLLPHLQDDVRQAARAVHAAAGALPVPRLPEHRRPVVPE